MRLPALVALLSIALLPGTTAHVAPGSPPRVLLIGLDGADWRAIDPLIAAGRLPAFERLKRDGRTAVLKATPPLVSPLLWTTIATGRAPEDHGVLDFMVDVPSGEQAPIAATSRRVQAIWNIVSDAERPVAVVGWWASWPAEQVRGTIVSDRVAPQLRRSGRALDEAAVAPKDAVPALLPFITTADRLTLADLQAYVPATQTEYAAARRTAADDPKADADGGRLYQNRLAHLAAIVAGTRTYGAIAEHLVKTAQPDFFAVYLAAIDTVSHLFVRDARRGPRAIARAYEDADRIIGRLAAAAAPETLVIVCSDHGFQPATAGITEDPSDLIGPATAWHRPYGIVGMIEARQLARTRAADGPSGAPSRAEAPGRAPVARVAPLTTSGMASPLDVTPTILHALGLAVSREMPGRVLDELLPGAAYGRGRAAASVATYERPGRQASGSIGLKVDPAAMARLRALGYVGAASTSLAGQNLGEVLYRAGRLEAAERELIKAIERQPGNVGAHLWLAKTLRDQGKSQQALGIYERVLTLDPRAGEALLEAVDVALASGASERAKAMVTRRRTGSGADAWTRTAGGAVAAAERRTADAEREFRAALAADPIAYEPLSRLVDLSIAAGRAAGVLPAVRAAVARAPDSPRHQALLGETLLAARDAAGAESAFERALALAPESAAVRLELARAQMARARAERAVATLGPVPATPERARLLGAAFSALGRWKEAAAEFRTALASGPSVDLLNGLGWAEYKQGRTREALDAFQRSLAVNPDQPQIRDLVATLKTVKTAGSVR